MKAIKWFLLALLCVANQSAGSRNLGSVASIGGGSGGAGGGGGGGFGDGTSLRRGGHCAGTCRRRECSGEQRVKEDLLCGYDRTSRPVRQDTAQIRVHIAVALFHILDTDEKHQTFSALMSIRLRWTDHYLAWSPEDYNGTRSLHIPSSSIWTPDVIISNSADDNSKTFMGTNVIVWSDGSVLWMFPALVKVTCNLDVRHFPFDSQSCNVTFISWTYHLYQVDLWHDEGVDSNKNYYTEVNQEWNVSRISYSRSVGVYACCREPWPDVTITIDMTRRSLFYIFNLIFPCLLMYMASFLGFFLPIESGEKVNLELTILLALVVFLLIVGDTLPPTPDAIPLVGLLFGVTMLMVSLALLMGVVVTNVHIRKFTSTSPMPACLRAYVSRFHCRRCLRRRRPATKQPMPLPMPLPRQPPPPPSQPMCLAEDDDGDDDELEELIETTQFARVGRNGGGSQPSSPPQSQPPPARRRSVAYVANLRRASMVDYLPDRRGSSCSGGGGGGGCRGGSDSRQRQRNRAGDATATSAATTAAGSADDGCVCGSPEAWVALARSVDRLLFWLFLAISVGVMSVIYRSVPSGCLAF